MTIAIIGKGRIDKNRPEDEKKIVFDFSSKSNFCIITIDDTQTYIDVTDFLMVCKAFIALHER